jgi:hypothetical protein
MNVFQHCKWLRVFGSLMVLMVLSIVGISAYSIVLVCQARTKHGPPSMYPLGVRTFDLLALPLATAAAAGAPVTTVPRRPANASRQPAACGHTPHVATPARRTAFAPRVPPSLRVGLKPSALLHHRSPPLLHQQPPDFT